MNTIVKTLPRYFNTLKFGDSPFGHLAVLAKDKVTVVIFSLVIAIFVSGLGVVYNQEQNRVLFNELSSLQQVRDSLYVRWGQLLVEESTWSTQSRVQRIATQRLNMVMPKQKNIVIVE